jgi:hypothetical protein
MRAAHTVTTRAILLVSAAACAAALAACGGSSSKPKAGSNSQLAMAECFRSHGVPNFPDPISGSGGEGFPTSESIGSQTITIEGVALSGPAFEAAVKTCKLFGGGSAPPPVSESQKLKLFQFAECMRKHGVPNYPDPVFPPGGGIERPDASGLNLQAPAVREAAKTCNNA